jgi:hypothetical protein
VAGREVLRHLGLELVRCVAVTVANQDLIAREEVRPAAAGELDAFVLAHSFHSRQDQITGARRSVPGQETSHRLGIHPTDRVRRLGPLDALGGKSHDIARKGGCGGTARGTETRGKGEGTMGFRG